MNRERCKELLPIFQAFADGEDIQCGSLNDNSWSELGDHANFDDNLDYRIKPKPREWMANPELKVLTEVVDGQAYHNGWVKVREITDEDL